MKKAIRMEINLPVKIVKKRKWHVASCDILDVASQGETQKAARDNLIEALTLFFMSCIERNTLDAVLKECGFTSVELSTPASHKKDDEHINIPLYLLPSKRTNDRCHA